MSVRHVNDQEFPAAIADGLVLVDFWATWCGPCKMIDPILEETASEMQGQVMIAKLNVDDSHATPGQYGVMGVPTLLLFKNGEPVDKLVGFQKKDQIKAMIKRHLYHRHSR